MKSMSDLVLDEGVLVRRTILECLYRSGGGHYGGSLSVADILLVLCRDIISLNSATVGSAQRDRLILSKGHAAAALYAVLQHCGLLQECDLADYGRANRGLEGHPDMTQTEGVDFSTGSLGQGISVGLGMALALRSVGAHIWVVVGDGECQEGQTWEAAMLASRYNVSNLHVIVDSNGAQEIGWIHDLRIDQEPVPQMAEKWSSFEWHVQKVRGHEQPELLAAFSSARAQQARPSVILAKTMKGRGVGLIEKDPERYHCAVLTEFEHQKAIDSLYA
jgi:transketolase